MAKNKITKNAEGYGYKYADMAQVHDYIDGIGGKYYQYTKTDEYDKKTYVWTHRFPDAAVDVDLDLRGAEVVEAVLSNGKQNPAQAIGSALTYARRYSLYMAYGIAVADNDGEDLTIPTDYQQPEQQTYRQLVTSLAMAHGITFSELQEQYEPRLVRNDTEEHYKAVYEQLQRDVEKR